MSNNKKRFVYSIALLIALIAGLSLFYFFSLKKDSSVISIEKARNVENLVPIAILGSGPAGLSAAIYGARANIKTVVLLGNKPGGALMETTYIENWPGREKILGSELIQNLKNQANKFGAEFLEDAVIKTDFSQWPYRLWTEDGKKLNALSVIIATGSTPRTLGVPGEREYWGKGVTTCAICDAPFHKGNDVVVIGGGDSAVEEALQLSAYAKTVTILVRKDSMRAAQSMQDRLKAVDNISVLYNTEVQKIEGEGDEVKRVELINNKTNETFEKNVSGVFLAIGHLPNSTVFKDYISLNTQGYINLKGRSQKTNIPGVFAAGDVADPEYKQAGVASGNGIKAALEATEFLQNRGFNKEVLSELDPQYFEPFIHEGIEVEQVTQLKDLEDILKTTLIPVIVDFYAPYCPSCMQMLPFVQAVAAKLNGQVRFIKVDTSESPDIAAKYNVRAIPLMLVFKDNQLVARYNEAMSKSELFEFAQQFIEE